MMPPRWEYASLAITSKWIQHEKKYEWQISVRVGPDVNNNQVIDEKSSSPDTLKWLNWLGSQGWEVVSSDFPKRAFTQDDANSHVESYRSAYLFYLKRFVPS